MKYVLGIDQGGSKTHAIIMEQSGKVLGLGKSYGTCHSSSSVEIAMKAVEEAAGQAFLESGLQKSDLSYIAAGMTGVDWDDEAKLLEDAIKSRFDAENVYVVNDCIIAMRAGTTNDVAGILCVGSGTNCAVKNKEELFVYGFYIPDEHQGGMSLGNKTVQAVFDSHIGLLDPTTLTGEVLDFFGVDTVDELLFKRSKGLITVKDYLAIPHLLERAALAGDNVAVNIWIHYGKSLASYITARMKMMGLKDEEIEIVLSGSIFKCKLPEFSGSVETDIKKYAPNATIREAVYEPIVGAGLLAIDKLGTGVGDDVYRNLEDSSEHFQIKR